MTRRAAYGVGLFFFLAALAMNVAAVIIPEWINWEPDVPAPAKRLKYTYGLHTRCTTLTDTCTPFPQYSDCQGPTDRQFCSLWRTTGWLESVAIVLELATVVAFMIPLLGGKQKRQDGWRLVAVVLGLAALCQVAATSIVAWLHNRDARFFEGWVLGRSFALSVSSWAICVLVATGLVSSAYILEEEDGYELILDAASAR